jgi:hypothetical protein
LRKEASKVTDEIFKALDGKNDDLKRFIQEVMSEEKSVNIDEYPGPSTPRPISHPNKMSDIVGIEDENVPNLMQFLRPETGSATTPSTTTESCQPTKTIEVPPSTTEKDSSPSFPKISVSTDALEVPLPTQTPKVRPCDYSLPIKGFVQSQQHSYICTFHILPC